MQSQIYTTRQTLQNVSLQIQGQSPSHFESEQLQLPTTSTTIASS